MSSVRFTELFFWELRRVARAPLLWMILALVSAAFVWGALDTSIQHRAQTVTQARIIEREAAWSLELRERAERYAASAAEPLPYWQDPTDVAGFGQYYLLRHSAKPHLPLSALANGVSDRLPSWLRVKLATPFGISPAYDYHNPRGLALGAFDLAFAVVYLLPVALILLFGLLATFERDHGLVRLIAAQPVRPLLWLGARMVALLAIVLPATWLALIVALAVAGTPLWQAVPELIAALGLVGAYVLFWSALSGGVLASWPRASGAIGVLVVLWAALLIAIPALVNTAVSAASPSAPAARYIDAERRMQDELEAASDEVLESAFRSRADLAPAIGSIPSIDYATMLTFLVPEAEARLESLRHRVEQARALHARASTWAGYLSPPLGLESALATLAGTDLARHREFERQTRAFQLELREYFYPLMQRQIASPTPRPVPDSRGRLSFTAYDSVPTFAMQEAGARNLIAAVLPTIGWLCGLSILLGLLAAHALRRWPEDL